MVVFCAACIYSNLKDTYRRVAVVGIVGYCLWAISAWFASQEEAFYTSLYVFVTISLFCLMAATLYDMEKMLCAWRFYPICFCVTTHTSNQDPPKELSNIESSAFVDLRLNDT